MVGSVAAFICSTIFATRLATESNPVGNITFAAGVFTWFHLMDGGLPPKVCALVIVALAVVSSNKRDILRQIFIRCESKQFVSRPDLNL